VKRANVCKYSQPCSIGTVKSATSDLDDEGCIGEGLLLKVFGVLRDEGQIVHTGNWNGKRTGVGTSAPVTRSTGASK
jgi:hypothetical protein